MWEFTYKTYQIKSISETDYAFRNWECAEKHRFSIDDYKEVYSDTIQNDQNDQNDQVDYKSILEKLFFKFNVNKPDNFRGHSLSVSDVVAIKKSGECGWQWYYCDSMGWREITNAVEVEGALSEINIDPDKCKSSIVSLLGYTYDMNEIEFMSTIGMLLDIWASGHKCDPIVIAKCIYESVIDVNNDLGSIKIN